MLTDVKVRRTLYRALIKSQICYTIKVWSPGHLTLKQKTERIPRRPTRWILRVKQGELLYKERLIQLDILPVTYDRDFRDLVFPYKALHGHIVIAISGFV